MNRMILRIRYRYDRWIVRQAVKNGVAEEAIKQEYIFLVVRNLEESGFSPRRRCRRAAHRIWKWVYQPALADL